MIQTLDAYNNHQQLEQLGRRANMTQTACIITVMMESVKLPSRAANLVNQALFALAVGHVYILILLVIQCRTVPLSTNIALRSAHVEVVMGERTVPSILLL